MRLSFSSQRQRVALPVVSFFFLDGNGRCVGRLLFAHLHICPRISSFSNSFAYGTLAGIHRRPAADGNDKPDYVSSKVLGTGSEDRDASPLLSRLVGADKQRGSPLSTRNRVLFLPRYNGRWGDAAGWARRCRDNGLGAMTMRGSQPQGRVCHPHRKPGWW